ncbi:hypothetical protein KXW36_001669, partial [Aspergillus fumigatus]
RHGHGRRWRSIRRVAENGAGACAEGRQGRAAAGSAHLLLRRAELSEASEGSRRQGRHGAGRSRQTRDRLPRPERADRAWRGRRDPLFRHREDPLRGRARRRDRQEGETSHRAERDGLRVRLHDRQRRLRADMAKSRSRA